MDEREERLEVEVVVNNSVRCVQIARVWFLDFPFPVVVCAV